LTGSNPLFHTSPYLRRYSHLTAEQFSAIDQFLQQQLESSSDNLHKTHYFDGRYENIYLNRNLLPELKQLMTEARGVAADILDMEEDALSVGFWFNYMPPGHITTLHTHNDIDELLSGVIYLTVPQNSGNLILKLKEQDIELEPVIGNYVFFDPATPHEVSKNCSTQSRLSIGMNFGPKESRADCFATYF
jgi:hypothetical protein